MDYGEYTRLDEIESILANFRPKPPKISDP